jgi:hypothetical protein
MHLEHQEAGTKAAILASLSDLHLVQSNGRIYERSESAIVSAHWVRCQLAGIREAGRKTK